MPNGIIYGANSKIIRRIVIGANNLAAHVGPGEALIAVDNPVTLEQATEAVQRATGVPPPSARCVVIQGNAVEAVIMADPDLDGIPGRTLQLHARADVGWTRNQSGDFDPPPRNGNQEAP